MAQKIGQRIRALREKQGLTRSQLARAVGVSFAGAYNWEQAGREPRMDTLTRLAEVLGVSVHFLMTGKEGAEEPPRAVSTPKTMDVLLKKAQSDFASAMGLSPTRVRVTVEEIIGPVAGEVGRKHSTG